MPGRRSPPVAAGGDSLIRAINSCAFYTIIPVARPIPYATNYIYGNIFCKRIRAKVIGHFHVSYPISATKRAAKNRRTCNRWTCGSFA